MYEADDLTEETEEIILKRAQASVERARFTLKGAEIRKTESLQFEIPRETLETEEGARRSELSLQTRRKTHPVGLIKKSGLKSRSSNFNTNRQRKTINGFRMT